jgi:hypothetical protein
VEHLGDIPIGLCCCALIMARPSMKCNERSRNQERSDHGDWSGHRDSSSWGDWSSSKDWSCREDWSRREDRPRRAKRSSSKESLLLLFRNYKESCAAEESLRRAEGGNKCVSFETRHHKEKKRSNAHLQNESMGYREKLYLGHPKFGCQYSRPAAFDQQTVGPTRPPPADKRHHVPEKLTTPDVRKSSKMFRRPSEPFTQKPADTGKLPRKTPALTLLPKDFEKNSTRARNESVKRIEVSPSSEPVLTSHSNDMLSKSTLVTPTACDVELSWECGTAALQPEVLSPLLQGGTAGVYPPSWQREGNFRTSPPLLGLQGSSNLGSLHPHDRNFASSVQNSTPTMGGVTKVVSDMDNVRYKDC